MKLSEVIKAREEGSQSEFVNGPYKFKPSKHSEKILIEYDCDYGYFHIPLDGWEEVKPPRQWSEKELMLFKLLPDWAKWIAKDKYGTWFVYENEPTAGECNFFQNENDSNALKEIGAFDFLTITFEESPVYIGDLKGE